MQDTLTFKFSQGYFDLGNPIDVPEGALISPSRNVLYDMNGRLTSFRGFAGVYSEGEGPQIGGNKAFVLDKDTVAFYGKLEDDTLINGIGNVTQAVGRSIWFVGNANSSLRIYDLVAGQFKGIGGEYHLETLTIPDSTVNLTQLTTTAVAGAVSSNGSYFQASAAHGLSNNTPVKIRRRAQLPTGLEEDTVYYIRRIHQQGAEADKFTTTNTTFKLMEYYEEQPCVAPTLAGFQGPDPRTKIKVASGPVEETTGPVWEVGNEVYILSNETDKDLLLRYYDYSNVVQNFRPYTTYYIESVSFEEDEDEEQNEFITWYVTLSLGVGQAAVEFVPSSNAAGYDQVNEVPNITELIKLVGGKPVDLTSDGTENSIVRSTSTTTQFTFTGEDSTDILTSTATLTFNSGEGVTVFPTGTMPSPLKENTLYYARLYEGDSTRFRVAENTGSGPIELTNAGSGGFIVDVSPFLNVTFTSTTPAITSRQFSVAVEDDFNENQIAEAIRNSLRADSEISANFFVNSSADDVLVQDRVIRPNNLSIALASGNGVSSATSDETQAGGAVLEYEFSNSIPHFAKYSGGSWSNPVPVGLPELDELDKPILTVTTPDERGRGFDGLIVGSRTARVARKRFGAVSIASPPSNLVIGPETGATLYVNIPVPSPDDSPREDNSWFLYFTFSGLGSTATHTLFPLEIPEAELDGSAEPELRQSGNAKYRVVKQSLSNKNDRIVEVEFLDNDLLPLDPFDDYYPAEPCRFIVKLGNSMCLIGTGDDGTGVDVSFPNNYEAYTPEWRDWLAEAPVSVATETELGYFWICSANNTYIAQWTGVTEDSPPILIEKRSAKIGCLGENASVCVGGMLYLLDRGKTPVRMTPQGEADISFGARVQEFFRSTVADEEVFDETTSLAWDSANNSIVFTCKDTSISFQIDSQLWSAPIYSDFNSLCSFEINGNTYLTSLENVGEGEEDIWKLATWTWNSGLEYDWNVTGAFQMGRYGRALKDLTKVEVMYSTPYLKPLPTPLGENPTPEEEEEYEDDLAAVNLSNSLVIKAYKNYRNDAVETLVTVPLVRVNSTHSTRKYVEKLDYDTVSLRIDGKLGGQTIHLATCEVDVHRIERTSL